MQLIAANVHDNHPKIPPLKILLMLKVAINRNEDIKLRFSLEQQQSVSLPSPSALGHCADVVPLKRCNDACMDTLV